MRKKLLLKAVLSFSLGAYLSVLFTPIFNVTAETPQKSAEHGRAECVMEINSRRILYETEGDLRLPMASTTKILTAATVLALCDDLEDSYTIPPAAEGIEGSSVYLKSGDVYTVKDLLYGLMLRSGNDCATALALYCSESINRFSIEMNQIAQKAGALASHFKNPHGLPCNGHYTTARDLSLITCYAMQQPIFREIVSTRYYPRYHWTNKNKMLTQYDGGIGVKTGYTKQAGKCLVSAAERNGMTLVCTVLDCPFTYKRSSTLLDDAFSAYHMTELLNKNTPIPLKVGANEVKTYVKEDYQYPLLDAEKEWINIKTFSSVANINKKKKDEIVGQFEIYLSKHLLFSGNLYKL